MANPEPLRSTKSVPVVTYPKPLAGQVGVPVTIGDCTWGADGRRSVSVFAGRNSEVNPVFSHGLPTPSPSMWRPEDFVKRRTPAGTTLDDAQLLLGFREGRHCVDGELRSNSRRASDEYQADVQREAMVDSRDTLREMRLQQLAEMEARQMAGNEKGRSVSSGDGSAPSRARKPFSECNDAGKQHSQRSSLLSSISSITGSVRGEIQDIKLKIADIR